MSNTLAIRKDLRLIAELLWSNGCSGVVCFDHKSYDDETDIPHLDIDGERVLVDTFNINRDGSQFTIISGRDSYILDMDAIPSEWDDDYFIEIGLDTLLRDVYYETEESYEIGDYELDFIKNYPSIIKIMSKVYIVNCETITLYDDSTDFDTASVHTTKDGAIAGLRNAIESRCVFLKDNWKLQFNDEDYAEDFDGYDTFEDFWEDFIKDNMHSSDYWTYSNYDDLTINIYIKEVELSN